MFSIKKENNITIKADFDFLYKNFNILFRNGWLKYEGVGVKDIHETTIPCAYFQVSQESDFTEYIEHKLMKHKGMSSLANNMRQKIQSDLIEVFNNIFLHSKTIYPFFICGQYYPSKKSLILTTVDLGVGFLQPIAEFTKGGIKTSQEAIRWALEGNSSRIIDATKQIGGFGLQGIYEYCCDKKGAFQICTGDNFFDTELGDLSNGYKRLELIFDGSIINLTFNFTN